MDAAAQTIQGGARMKITSIYLPICLGFIISRVWKLDDIPLLIVAIIAFVLDMVLVIRG